MKDRSGQCWETRHSVWGQVCVAVILSEDVKGELTVHHVIAVTRAGAKKFFVIFESAKI